MEITIRATEFEPDERLKVRAQQKVARLQRYVPDLERADIELSLEPTRGVESRRIVQINLIMYGRVVVRAVAKAADLSVAIDAAVDNLKRQLLRYKEKRDDWRHGHLHVPEEEPAFEQETTEELSEQM